MNKTRRQIIKTTSKLIAKQGYHATGLNQIVDESGAPKGSLYYYFPGGKEHLTAEAIELTGREVAERIRLQLAQIEDAAEAIRVFVLNVSKALQASAYQAGGPITTVALETADKSERLNRACVEAYELWEAAFKEKLITSGVSADRAVELATCIVAAIEGAIVLSRTKHDLAPLERVAEVLSCLVGSAGGH